jgi:hypothetical protein
MQNYNGVVEFLKTCNNEYKGKLIDKNTRVYRIDYNKVAIKYRNTDIMVFNETYTVFNTNGCITAPIKNRINKYQNNCILFNCKQVWYIAPSCQNIIKGRNLKVVEFFDDIDDGYVLENAA